MLLLIQVVLPVQDWERKVTAESDEDMDGGFFSLFKEKGKGICAERIQDYPSWCPRIVLLFL